MAFVGRTATGPQSSVQQFIPTTCETKYCISKSQSNAATQAPGRVKIENQQDKSTFGMTCGSSIHHNGHNKQRTLKRAAGARIGSLSGTDTPGGINLSSQQP